MADEQTPITPEESTVATTEPQTPQSDLPPAEAYIKEELAAARQALRNTQLYGSVLIAILGIYLIYVAATFNWYLQPENAKDVVIGMVTGQIDNNREGVLTSISSTVDSYVQQAPDMAITTIKDARSAAFSAFKDHLTDFTKNTADSLGQNLDSYLDEHKTEIAALLEAHKGEKAEELGNVAREMVEDYMKLKPAGGGQSLQELVDESHKMLTDADKRLAQLAAGKNLNPNDQRLRRAIAAVAMSVDEAELKPLTMPELPALPEGGDEAAAPDTKAPAAKAPAAKAPAAAPKAPAGKK